ncbi:MAG TPA: hypothetical protein VGR31_05900 [Planctomycetota bacterium]|jgi:hypothetical protein|nr:hypothetical protein [Planctomycetota bacterium]
MDPQDPTQTAIRFSLQAAAGAAGTTDAHDGPGLVEMHRHMRELEAHLQEGSRADAAQICALAMGMTEKLIGKLHPTSEELLSWVHFLLQHVGAMTGVPLAQDWTTAAPPPSAPSAPKQFAPPPNPTQADLRMAKSDGIRLGELLVQMSFLKSEDVQRALDVQHQTNCRLGEAMVTLGLITQKALDNALRVQTRRRGGGT